MIHTLGHSVVCVCMSLRGKRRSCESCNSCTRTLLETYEAAGWAERVGASGTGAPAPASAPLQERSRVSTELQVINNQHVCTADALLVTASPFISTPSPSTKAGHTWYFTSGAEYWES